MESGTLPQTMTARLLVPELPASFGATLAAAAALAYVFAKAGPAIWTSSAARAAVEVHQKSKRLMDEITGFVELRAEFGALTAAKTNVTGAADVSAQLEDLLERAQQVRASFTRIAQACAMADKALRDARPYEHAIEQMLPGWGEVTKAIEPDMLPRFRAELAEATSGFDAARRDIAEEAEALLSTSLAEQGLDEWAASLPDESGPLVDEDDGVPVRWDASLGWVEGRT